MTSVLAQFKKHIDPQNLLGSDITHLVAKTGFQYDDLATELYESSRSIGQEFARQEKVTQADLNILKELFRTLFITVKAKQQAYARIDDPEFAADRTKHENMCEVFAKALDASFQYLLAPFIDEVIKDDQVLYKVYDAYCQEADQFLATQDDLPIGSELADSVCGEMQHIQREAEFLIDDQQAFLLNLLRSKKFNAGQSVFSELYFPDQTKPIKLDENDFRTLADQAGWEFSENAETGNIANIFGVTVQYAFKLAREESQLKQGAPFTDEATVEHFQTLFDKSIEVILKPLAQAARNNSNSDPVLSKLLLQVGDMYLDQVFDQVQNNPGLVNLYKQKMHEAYKRVFSVVTVQEAAGKILDCLKKSPSGLPKLVYIANQKAGQSAVPDDELNVNDIRTLSSAIGRKIGITQENSADDCDLVMDVFNHIQDLVYDQLEVKTEDPKGVKAGLLKNTVTFAEQNILQPLVDAIYANDVDSNLEDLKNMMRNHIAHYPALMAERRSDEKLFERLALRMEHMVIDLFQGKTFPPDFSLN